jgi:hypothetical protein
VVAPLPLAPPIRATLDAWHDMIARGDLSELPAFLSERVVFRSPVAHKAYEGSAAVALILRTAAAVFADFVYHRSFAAADGASVVLEFSARVGERTLKGIDMIRFDEQGRIVEFEVMVRPATGVQALGEAMAAALAGRIGTRNAL